MRSVGRGSRRRGARLIVLVHCSNGDVMVSARLRVGTLFGAQSNMRSVFGLIMKSSVDIERFNRKQNDAWCGE